MRPMNEIEIELPQIVLDRADAAYAQIRQQAAQESPAGRRVRSFPPGSRHPVSCGDTFCHSSIRHRRRNHGIPPLSGRAHD